LHKEKIKNVLYACIQAFLSFYLYSVPASVDHPTPAYTLLTVSSVIRNNNPLLFLITGKTSYQNSTSLLVQVGTLPWVPVLSQRYLPLPF